MTNPTLLQQLASDGSIREELDFVADDLSLSDTEHAALSALPEEIYAAVMAEDTDLDFNTDDDDLANALAGEASRAKTQVINEVRRRLSRGPIVTALEIDELTFDVDGVEIYVDESDYGYDTADGHDLAIWIGNEDYQLTTDQARRWITALSKCVDGIERRTLQRQARLMAAEAQEHSPGD